MTPVKNKLTPAERRFWLRLQASARQYAATTGTELVKFHNDASKQNCLANEYLQEALAVYTTADVVKMVKLWIVRYRIALDPDSMECFHEFHKRCNDYIHANIGDKRAFEFD